MQKILVTTDYSTNSKSAIRFAIQFALQSPCELVFYHVFEGVENNSWNIKNGNTTQEFNLEKLKNLVNSVYKENHLRPRKFTCAVETGIDTNTLILEYAKKNKFNYICIGTRGGGILKKILGTTTSNLIQYSHIPVLVVPKNYKLNPIKEIWYSSDLANIKNELSTVQKIAKTFKADVHVYHYDYMIEVEEITAKLNKIAAKYITKGTFIHFRKMKIDNTLSQNLQIDINKHKPSLVVLFTQQDKKWYDRIFLRNNSEEVTFDTKVPLLILRKKSV